MRLVESAGVAELTRTKSGFVRMMRSGSLATAGWNCWVQGKTLLTRSTKALPLAPTTRSGGTTEYKNSSIAQSPDTTRRAGRAIFTFIPLPSIRIRGKASVADPADVAGAVVAGV